MRRSPEITPPTLRAFSVLVSARNSTSPHPLPSAAAVSSQSPTAGWSSNWGKCFRLSLQPTSRLLLSIFKFDRMEWAIEKCTELGVARMVPVIAQRTEAHLAAAAGKRVERWRRLALQASEQSRRDVPPEISQPINLKEAVALAGAARIVLSEAEQTTMLRDVLSPDAPEFLLAIGPEGGWTEPEVIAVSRQRMGLRVIRSNHPARRNRGDCRAGDCRFAKPVNPQRSYNSAPEAPPSFLYPVRSASIEGSYKRSPSRRSGIVCLTAANAAE